MDPTFEAVEVDAASSFRSMWFTCGSFAEDHTWHFHPEFELTWVLRTNGTRFVGDNIEPYLAGDLVFVGPNLPHCWHDEPGPVGPEVIVFQFHPQTFCGGFLDLPEFQAIKQLLRAAQCGLHITGDIAPAVKERMRALLDLGGVARLLGLLDILRILSEEQRGLRRLASADYHLHNDITPANRHRIEQIHRHVRQNLANEINQAEMAKSIGLTPPAFSRFFRRATGHTFVGFVNLLRISEACRAMTETNEGITQIAMNCGYNNIANFNRQFLALKGMNPTKYRERHQKLQEGAISFVAAAPSRHNRESVSPPN